MTSQILYKILYIFNIKKIIYKKPSAERMRKINQRMNFTTFILSHTPELPKDLENTIFCNYSKPHPFWVGVRAFFFFLPR